jgi:hypothetical protein
LRERHLDRRIEGNVGVVGRGICGEDLRRQLDDRSRGKRVRSVRKEIRLIVVGIDGARALPEECRGGERSRNRRRTCPLPAVGRAVADKVLDMGGDGAACRAGQQVAVVDQRELA